MNKSTMSSSACTFPKLNFLVPFFCHVADILSSFLPPDKVSDLINENEPAKVIRIYKSFIRSCRKKHDVI